MRLHRFFLLAHIDKEKINSFSDPGLIHQLSRVFRLHVGDRAIFFDGAGADHESEIVSMTKSEVEFRVIETRYVKPVTQRKIVLAFSIIKKDNVEWIIEKGTELGVSEFIPLVTERSEKKGFNIERARKIMIEACEQSGRSEVPKVCEAKRFEDFLEEEKRKIIIFHTEGNAFGSSRSNLGSEKRFDLFRQEEIVACTGPEGGWSESEVEAFKKSGAKIVKLNFPILRAETAAIAAATLLLDK